MVNLLRGWKDRDQSMPRKFNFVHATRGIYSLIIVIFTAHVIGWQMWNHALLPMFGDNVQAGALAFVFMLSGLVIFSAYQSYIGDQEVAAQFLFKRFMRIYPIYWYILIACIPFDALLVGEKTTFSMVIRSIFLVPDPTEPLLPTAWSLSFLLVFYALFAVLLFLGRSVGTFIATLWFLGIVINFTQGLFEENHWLNFLFHKYHLFFFAGGFLGYLAKKIRFSFPMLLIIIGASGVLLAIFNQEMRWIPLDDMFNFGIPVSVLLMGLVSYDLQKEVKLPKLLHFWGQASYSVYLSHYPTLIVLFTFAGQLGLDVWMGKEWVMILLVICTILLGWLTHTVIEKPLLSFIFYRRNIQVSSDSYLMKKMEQKSA